MKKALKKLFLGKKTLIVVWCVAVVFWVLWGVFCMINGGLVELASDAVFYLALMIGLLVAYRKGETNIQKVLMGALFMLLINSNIEIMWVYIGIGQPVIIAIDIITLILALIIFICHIVLQSDHIGESKAVILNQCCAIIFIIIMLYGFRQAFIADDGTILDLTFIPAWAFTYLVIVCMETRIQYYKNIRCEARNSGTWNDETRAKAKEIFKL